MAPELRLSPDLHVGGVGRGLELAAEVYRRKREKEKDNSQSDEEKSVEMALSRLDKWEKGGGGGGTPSLSPHSPHCAAGRRSAKWEKDPLKSTSFSLPVLSFPRRHLPPYTAIHERTYAAKG